MLATDPTTEVAELEHVSQPTRANDFALTACPRMDARQQGLALAHEREIALYEAYIRELQVTWADEPDDEMWAMHDSIHEPYEPFSMAEILKNEWLPAGVYIKCVDCSSQATTRHACGLDYCDACHDTTWDA